MLISSKTCPFAHRVEIVRILADLQDEVSIKFVDPVFNDGWRFIDEFDSVLTLRDLYKKYQPMKDTNFSVPVFIDGNLFNTESLDICRMWMPKLFNDNINEWIDDFDQRFSRAHYRAGHAKTEQEYHTNFQLVFSYLDELDKKLINTYIFGDRLSIADIIAYTHLCRFDAIYYHLFKLNHKHIRDYTNIYRWMRNLLTLPAFYETTDIETAKKGYYLCNYHQHDKLTPFIPLGNGGFDLAL
jgi:putative glutathione S-transferase